MTTPTHPPIDIPALRRLEAAATRGPWRTNDRGTQHRIYGNEHHRAAKAGAGYIPPDRNIAAVGAAYGVDFDGEDKANAALIVAARNNLVGLMDRVEELERALERAGAALNRPGGPQFGPKGKDAGLLMDINAALAGARK